MTQDDIIRMAREVGFVAYGEDAGEYRIPTPAFHGRLERFAALVAAEIGVAQHRRGYESGQRDGAAAEREACAELVESRKTGANELMDAVRDMEAAAIRARGDKT